MSKTLFSAAKYGHLELCKVIVEKTENKNPQDLWGDTPVHYAFKNGHLEVCKLFFELNQEWNPKDRNGDSFLHKAVENNHLDFTFSVHRSILMVMTDV